MFLLVAMIANRSVEEPTETRVDQLTEEYAQGEISLETFEERVAIALDPEAQRCRDRLEEIDGIGPERSAQIAQEFGSIEALREADQTELTAIRGIGTSTAELITSEFEQ